MYAFLSGHTFVNDIQAITQLFFPNEGFIVTSKPRNTALSVISRFDGNVFFSVLLVDGKVVTQVNTPVKGLKPKKSELKMAAALGVFEACSRFTRIVPPWGLLVGVRPTKVVHEMWDKGDSTDAILRRLTDYYRATPEKAALCVETAANSRRFLETADNYISLYIGIPFCVSRCLYCSFSSYLAHKYAKIADDYIAALIKELDFARLYIKAKGKRLQSIYIGGGTPTSLSEKQLAALLYAVDKHFSADEFTVEAGRPDTITREKLLIMAENGVTRISVNPQTLNNKTLMYIGRNHTAADFFKAYTAAKDYFTVNTDIIIGLPGETMEDTRNTLSQIEKLSPDNLTVHTLCVKRASLLKEQLDTAQFTDSGTAAKMIVAARSTAESFGAFPYYMYRNKNTLGNLENTGYAQKGMECVYNIQVTEERQSIIGVGAGAVTKHYDKPKNLVRRIYNVKTPEEYIGNIDKMIERKNKLYEFDGE